MKVRIIAGAVGVLAVALAGAGCSNDVDVDQTTSTAPGEVASNVTADATSVRDQAADHNDHDSHDLTAPVLADGQRWETDAPLRAAMTRIRSAVDSNLPAYHEGKLQVEDANALAIAVENDIDYMFANCKLDPEPDVALHALIARMMAAVEALRADPASDEGVPALVSVVNDYETTFDHEDFAPLTHE